MNKQSISFVVPAYNCSKTITESIDSIFETNFSEGDEVIIVNDNSSDATRKILTDLKSKYPLIIINNKTNKGCPASRNIGIRKAKNSLIFNLDSDDILAKHSVIKLKKCLIQQNFDLVAFSESWYFYSDTKKITHKRISPTGLYTLADFLSGVVSPGGNYLYKKKVWKSIGGYSEFGKGLHEYWGFTLKILANNYKMYSMPNSYYFHRVSENSLFYREINNKKKESILLRKMIEPYLLLIDDDDAKYIKETFESASWFYNLKTRGLRVKNLPHGRKGRVWYPMTHVVNRYINVFVLFLKKKFGIETEIFEKTRNLNFFGKTIVLYRIFFSPYHIHRTSTLENIRKIHLGFNTKISEYVVIKTGKAEICIGENSQINPFVVIYGGNGVMIGKNVMIGPHSMLAAGGHDYVQTKIPMIMAGSISKGKIVIEDDVWVGANVTITDGVKIGTGAVIGANSVVTKNIPEYAVAHGAPAVITKYRKQLKSRNVQGSSVNSVSK